VYGMDKNKILEYLESMINNEPDKDWEDYDRGVYDAEQDTVNTLIRAIKEGKFD
jgi:hypothetical protein